MALAEGVVDFDHDGAQAAVGAVAVPKTHRLEREAPNPRVAMQPDLTIRIRHAVERQLSVQPGQCATILRAAPVTMVAIEKTDGRKPVQRQRPGRLRAQAAHG